MAPHMQAATAAAARNATVQTPDDVVACKQYTPRVITQLTLLLRHRRLDHFSRQQ